LNDRRKAPIRTDGGEVPRFFVMAGLDPAIPDLRKMDARVKPAHDDGVGFNLSGKRSLVRNRDAAL
jgi:hypothetical protein